MATWLTAHTRAYRAPRMLHCRATLETRHLLWHKGRIYLSLNLVGMGYVANLLSVFGGFEKARTLLIHLK